VEMAGAIAELAHSIAYDFRHISTRCAKILLVEAGDRILPQFDPMLSKRAKRDLESLGVEVLVNTRVEEVGQGYAVLNGATIRAETVVWAAGVKSSPAGEWLGVKTDRSGRVIVEYDLSVPGHEEIFAIGDAAALVLSGSDQPLPGLAPVAKQQGYYVGNLINAWISKKKTLPPFKYKNYGTMATIGRNRGIAEMVRLRFTGFIGWLFWSLVHIYFLISFRNRLMVGLHWLWAYFAYQRGVRLITGSRSQM
jgi:NADH dehydrogenase